MCYFHEQSRTLYRNRVGPAPIFADFPVIEDARSVQIALNLVIQALVHRAIHHRSAVQILFGLQMSAEQVKGWK